MKWGHYQRECHRMIYELFPSRNEGYKWLWDNFKVLHFSDLDHKKDKLKIQEIYNALYKLSFKEEELLELEKGV